MAFKNVIAELVVVLDANADLYDKVINEAITKIDKVARRLTIAGTQITALVTVPIVKFGFESVKAFAGFDDAMVGSLAIMGDVSEEMRKEMEDTARTLSREGVTSAEDLAAAYFFLASAGLNAEQSMAALSTVERFAVAGRFDLATATSLLTDAQNALNLTSEDAVQNMQEMRRVADVLVKANTLADASTRQFAEALANDAAAALRFANKELEEGVAILAVFANQGFKSARAGTMLSIVMRDLTTSANKNSKAWAKLGVRVFDAQGKILPIADIIEGLEKRFAGMTDEQKRAAAGFLGFKDRSFKAIAALLGNSDALREYEKELKNASGTLDAVFMKQLKSFSAQMAIVFNHIEDVGIEIGRILAPQLEWLGEKLKDLAKWWRELSLPAQQFILILFGLAAIIGPVILSIGLMSGAIVALGTIFTGTTAIVLGWVLALGLLVVATVAVTDALGVTKTGMLDLVNQVRITGTSIGAWFQIAAVQVQKAWVSVFHFLKSGFVSLTGFVEVMAEKLAGALITAFGKIGQALIDKVLKPIQRLATVFNLTTLQNKIAQFQAVFNKGIDIAINNSNDKLLKKGREVYDELTKLDQDYKDQLAHLDDTIVTILTKDNKIPVIETAKDEAKKAEKEAERAESRSNRVADRQTDFKFQQLNLSRFSISGAGAFSRAPEVKATGVEARLDTLIQETKKNNKKVAVAGR